MARKNVEPVTFDVPLGAREAIKKHAATRKYAVTGDYIRALIEADMKAHGIEIDLSVDRGGDRRAKADKAEGT